jgi:hypothetical protein
MWCIEGNSNLSIFNNKLQTKKFLQNFQIQENFDFLGVEGVTMQSGGLWI